MSEPSRQIVEIVSWRLATEMVRRHPGIRIAETHPGGGQYDCLVLFLPRRADGPGSRLALNRLGSAHLFCDQNSFQSWTNIWSDYLAADDPVAFVQRLEAFARLPRPARIPASTPGSVTCRFIAAFLTHAFGCQQRWECRNAVLDESGGCELREDWFRSFRAARNRADQRMPRDILGQPARRFWFLVRNGTPVLCLETTGRAWDARDGEYDLMKLYRVRRRIWPVVSFVARDLLR